MCDVQCCKCGGTVPEESAYYVDDAAVAAHSALSYYGDEVLCLRCAMDIIAQEAYERGKHDASHAIARGLKALERHNRGHL